MTQIQIRRATTTDGRSQYLFHQHCQRARTAQVKMMTIFDAFFSPHLDLGRWLHAWLVTRRCTCRCSASGSGWRLLLEEARPVLRPLGGHRLDECQPKHTLAVTFLDGPVAFFMLHSPEKLALCAKAVARTRSASEKTQRHMRVERETGSGQRSPQERQLPELQSLAMR